MEKVVYKAVPKNKKLNEIYQKVAVEFAFARRVGENKFEQVHTFVLCRDFLHDVLRGVVTGEAIYIYGFKYFPRQQRFDATKTYLLFKFPAAIKEYQEHLERVMHLTGIFEKKLRIKRSKLYATQRENVFLIVGSRSWISSPAMISLFSFLIRLGVGLPKHSAVSTKTAESKTFSELMTAWKNVKATPTVARDIKRLPILSPNLGYILSHRKKLGLTLRGQVNRTTEIYAYHNLSGILSIAKQVNRERK